MFVYNVSSILKEKLQQFVHQQEQPLFWAQKTTEWKKGSVRGLQIQFGVPNVGWTAYEPRKDLGFVMILYHPLVGNMKYHMTVSPLPSLKPTASLHLKMHGWKTSFLLGWPFFRGVRKCLFPLVFLCRQMSWIRLPGGFRVLWYSEFGVRLGTLRFFREKTPWNPGGFNYIPANERLVKLNTSWWQLKYCLFSPRTLGNWSSLTHIFQMGWNHQPVKITLFVKRKIESEPSTPPWLGPSKCSMSKVYYCIHGQIQWQPPPQDPGVVVPSLHLTLKDIADIE